MKNTALQLAIEIVKENKNFIDGNIAEYMIQKVDADDNIFYKFLTDEEIEEMNGNVQKTQQLGDEVFSMLKENFNFDISEL